MIQHTAIVLRASLKQGVSVILFDSELGKIQGFPGSFARLSSGARISYSLEKKGTTFFLRDCMLLDMPLDWAREDFLFFHHVLELCEYFIPWESRSDSLFSLVSQLYTNVETLKNREAQKRFLHAFYVRVGLVPEARNLTLDQWINACVQENPHILKFKTAGFLKELTNYGTSV